MELFFLIEPAHMDWTYEVAGVQLIGDSTSDQTTLVIQQYPVCKSAMGQARL